MLGLKFKDEKAELKVMPFGLINDGKRSAAMVVLSLLPSMEFLDHTTLTGVYIDFYSDTIPNLLRSWETSWHRSIPCSGQQMSEGDTT